MAPTLSCGDSITEDIEFKAQKYGRFSGIKITHLVWKLLGRADTQNAILLSFLMNNSRIKIPI
jgi:hypothetical protein